MGVGNTSFGGKMKKLSCIIFLVLGLNYSAYSNECFIGELRMFGGNFAPRGWALADGQLLAISQNSALFSILGTTYGGDGRTTFALPDLRGRVAIHPGTGPGLTNKRLGQKGGVEKNTIQISQLPAKTKRFDITANSQGQKLLVKRKVRGAVENMQPYQGINHIICLQGIFPSRN